MVMMKSSVPLWSPLLKWRGYFSLDSLEVGLESVHESVLGLAHILHSACLAFNAINQVAAFASDIFLAAVFSTCVVALDSATVDNQWTICAFFALAYISALAVRDGIFAFFRFLDSRSNKDVSENFGSSISYHNPPFVQMFRCRRST